MHDTQGRPAPEGGCIYIRQSMSACVITNYTSGTLKICPNLKENVQLAMSACVITNYTSGTLKICPNLKENVQLAYIVPDADYDSGKLF